jgi:hypothetical protein
MGQMYKFFTEIFIFESGFLLLLLTEFYILLVFDYFIEILVNIGIVLK